MRVEG
ncbi:hypothetical protein CGLO_12292 [Colletotrichum gloeosporioides Cg-14]